MPFYKASKREDSFHSDTMSTVPVIASFDTEGTIKPLYVRIQGKALKVCSSWFQNESLVIRYHCTVEADGYVRDIVLLYHPSHMFWTVGTDFVS